ncbi:hypothetical protein [uncultured Desulfobacter sp.]|uniref:hypothetical protein n=1 Tax=uncultured Desulfobacter sp. TaxID=240139 RepID=UPI002AABC8A9|nr:hypothetical protein [uncultured Desulfobacter sp.]
MLEGFEKFTQQGRSFKPKISIRKRGQIGFNNGSINKFKLDSFDFVILYMNKDENKIAFEFTNDSNKDGAIKLVKRKNNYFVSGKSFLDFYSVSYEETMPMDATWNEEAQVAIAQIPELDKESTESESSSECDEHTDVENSE